MNLLLYFFFAPSAGIVVPGDQNTKETSESKARGFENVGGVLLADAANCTDELCHFVIGAIVAYV